MAKKSYKLTDKDFAKMRKVHAKANKYVDNRFHFYFSFNLRVLFLFTLAFIMGYTAFRLYILSFSDASVAIAQYKETGNVDSTIVRFQNDVIDNSNFIVGDSYLSSIVDDVGLDFNYGIDFGKNVTYEYTYSISGKATYFDSDNAVKFYKDYNLLKDVTNKAVGDKLVINQNINLDYDFYNNEAMTLKDSYGYMGNMHLVMHVKVDVTDDNFNHVNTIEKDINVDMPLLSDDVKITSDSFEENENFAENVDSKLIDPTALFFAVILIIVDTVLILTTFNYIIKRLPKKSKYCILRDGLLQDYDKIIVNSRKMNRLSQYNIIDCYSFQELMDAQKLLEKPIVYYEIVKDQKSIFYIIDGNDCYQFILKECDIDY